MAIYVDENNLYAIVVHMKALSKILKCLHTHTHLTTDRHSVCNISLSCIWCVSQCMSTIVSGSIKMCGYVICSVVHCLALNRGLIVWVQSNHLQKYKHLFWQHRKRMSQIKGLHSKMHGRRFQFWLLSCGPRKMSSYSFELFSALCFL